MLGGKFSIWTISIWNEIPAVVGNLVGGLALTRLTLYATHVKTRPAQGRTDFFFEVDFFRVAVSCEPFRLRALAIAIPPPPACER